VDLEQLAKKTEGFTGADLAAVANEAVMHSIRSLIEKGGEVTDEDIANAKIGMKDFMEAVEKLRPTSRADYTMGENPPQPAVV